MSKHSSRHASYESWWGSTALHRMPEMHQECNLPHPCQNTPDKAFMYRNNFWLRWKGNHHSKVEVILKMYWSSYFALKVQLLPPLIFASLRYGNFKKTLTSKISVLLARTVGGGKDYCGTINSDWSCKLMSKPKNRP